MNLNNNRLFQTLLTKMQPYQQKNSKKWHNNNQFNQILTRSVPKITKMKAIRNIGLTAILLFFIFPSFAQNRKLDKLEMYYDQGNYEVVYRKSKRYLGKPEFDHSALPSFYKALSMYRMAKDGDLKFTYEKSMRAYEDFLKRNPGEQFIAAHKVEIQDYENGLLQYVRNLNDLNKNSQAKTLLAKIDLLFNESHNFAEVINDPTQVDKTDENTGASSPTPVVIEPQMKRDSIIAYAQKFIGVPYQWGGVDPNGFDCSGFTKYVMDKYNVDLPRIAGDQYTAGKPVDMKKATKGDLVFFGKKNNVQHVGIVVSEPGEELTMIHASSSRGIMISNIEKSSYWKPKLLYTGRVIHD